MCLETQIFTKLLQNVCLINTHNSIHRYAKCSCKWWKTLWFYCVFWVFSYIIVDHSCLNCCMSTKLSQIVCLINKHSGMLTCHIIESHSCLRRRIFKKNLFYFPNFRFFLGKFCKLHIFGKLFLFLKVTRRHSTFNTVIAIYVISMSITFIMNSIMKYELFLFFFQPFSHLMSYVYIFT